MRILVKFQTPWPPHPGSSSAPKAESSFGALGATHPGVLAPSCVQVHTMCSADLARGLLPMSPIVSPIDVAWPHSALGVQILALRLSLPPGLHPFHCHAMGSQCAGEKADPYKVRLRLPAGIMHFVFLCFCVSTSVSLIRVSLAPKSQATPSLPGRTSECHCSNTSSIAIPIA